MDKIAVLGPAGTFSDAAAEVYIKEKGKRKKDFFDTIDDVFYSIGDTHSLGIVPIENTLAGFVQRTLDLLLERDVYIIGQLSIPVQFSLVYNVEKFQDIKKLYVQFKSKEQCRNIIKKMTNAGIVITESNMESLNKFKKGEKGAAAIIPRYIFDSSEHEFGIRNVTDSENNRTRFILLSSNKNDIKLNSDKDINVSIYVTNAENEPGVLYDLLKEFAINNINLVSIISRPTKKELGKYNFFIEISGKVEDKDKILNTLKLIRKNHVIKILGFYQ